MCLQMYLPLNICALEMYISPPELDVSLLCPMIIFVGLSENQVTGDLVVWQTITSLMFSVSNKFYQGIRFWN